MRSHRKTMRPRRAVSPRTLWLLRPLFRRSLERDGAWILRGVGKRVGPVLVNKRERPDLDRSRRSEVSDRQQGRFVRPRQDDTVDTRDAERK